MSYVNYNDEPDETAPQWSHSAFKELYFQTYAATHKRFPKWGIKDEQLLKKLRERFDTATLIQLIKHCGIVDFSKFYTDIDMLHDMYMEHQERKQEWKWS